MLSHVNSLRPHGLKHDRLPCPSLSPRVCSDSCTWIQWCYLAISSSATHFSFCLQSFPASRSFPMSWLFAPRSQSTGTSASVLPMSIQGWFPLGWIGLISLQSKGLLRVFSSIAIWKHQFFSAHQGMWAYNIWVPVFIYFIYPGMVLVSHIVILCLAFWGITK